MSKISVKYDDGLWTVGVADENAPLGMEYQDDNGQQILHESSNYETLDEAVNYIKGQYGDKYDSMVKRHSVFYTSDLIAEYPKEVKALGWDSEKRLKDVSSFCESILGKESEIEAIGSLDPYNDRERFETLIEDVGKLYKFEDRKDMQLPSGTLTGETYRIMAHMVVNESDAFDPYNFEDVFGRKNEGGIENAYNRFHEDIMTLDGIKAIHEGLCDHFESIYNEPSKYSEMIKDYEAKKESRSKNNERELPDENVDYENNQSENVANFE